MRTTHRRTGPSSYPVPVFVAVIVVVAALAGISALRSGSASQDATTSTSTPTQTTRSSLLYVADEENGQLIAINTASDTVAFDIPIYGTVQQVALATGSTGPFIYATDMEHNDIVSVQAATGTVWGTYPSANGTFSMAPTPDGQYVYIINTANHSSVTVMDTYDHKEVRHNFLPVGTFFLGYSPVFGTFTPDGRYWYTDNTTNTVNVVNVTVDVKQVAPWVVDVTVVNLSTIRLQSTPYYITSSPGGGTVVVGTKGGLEIINATSYDVASRLELGQTPTTILASPDGHYIFAASPIGVNVVNASTYQLIEEIPMQGGAYGMAMTPDGSLLYVSNPLSGTVSVVDTSSMTVSAEVQVGGAPMGMTLFWGT